MTDQELARKPAGEVRTNPELMRLYIERYKAVFNLEPNCASCSFKRDFKKFQSAVLNPGIQHQMSSNQNPIEMADFELKREHRHDILTYRKDNRAYRSYGNKVTADFVSNFLSEGTKEEIEQRKKMFKTLPDASKKGQAKKASNQAKKETKVETLQKANLETLKTEVAAIDNARELQELKNLEEQSGTPRKGAIEIIDARLAEIAPEPTGTVESTTEGGATPVGETTEGADPNAPTTAPSQKELEQLNQDPVSSKKGNKK